MAYQALYRKWRPGRFADVYGQDHITSTLKNELKSGKIGHAYLFTGTRGTGKTTCAKLMAKALNCLSPEDGEPCGQCRNCKLAEEDSLYDIVEIDAASKSRVEDVRGLIEEVVYAPAVGKYKVYIVDEVHMMTGNAFNALLKTLEEPPAYVVFILATTEVQKIPATILSRCQRFDFKRLSPETIAKKLLRIAESEGFELDADAAHYIGVLADGACRDAESILEMCQTAGKVTVPLVQQLTGMAGVGQLTEIMDAAAAGDTGAVLEAVDRLYEGSKKMDLLLSDLIACYRDAMLLKLGGGSAVRRAREDVAALRKTADSMETSYILYCIEELSGALMKTTRNSSNRIAAEVCLIKLCNPDYSGAPAALAARIARLESGALRQKPPAVPSDAAQQQPGAAAPPAKVPAAEAAEPPASAAVAPAQESAPPDGADTGLSAKMRPHIRKPGLVSFLPDAMQLSGDILEIRPDSAFAYDLLSERENVQALEAAYKAATGQEVRIVIRKNET